MISLSVIGVRAVLTEIMFVEYVLTEPSSFGRERESIVSHFGDFFESYRVVYSACGAFAPRERSVGSYERRGYASGIFACERFDYRFSGVFFVFREFFAGQFAGQRHFAVEAVGVRCAVRDYRAFRLRESGRERRMSMHDGADILESRVQLEVSGRVARRTQRAFRHRPVKIYHSHIVRLQFGVIHAARLDDDETCPR